MTYRIKKSCIILKKNNVLKYKYSILEKNNIKFGRKKLVFALINILQYVTQSHFVNFDN